MGNPGCHSFVESVSVFNSMTISSRRSYYSDYSDITQQYYDLPLAYFLTGVAVYIYSFWATLRKYVAHICEKTTTNFTKWWFFSVISGWPRIHECLNCRQKKTNMCFHGNYSQDGISWLVKNWSDKTQFDGNNRLEFFFFLFSGHAETAHNRIASVVLGFKEALLEEAEKKKDKQKFVHHSVVQISGANYTRSHSEPMLTVFTQRIEWRRFFCVAIQRVVLPCARSIRLHLILNIECSGSAQMTVNICSEWVLNTSVIGSIGRLEIFINQKFQSYMLQLESHCAQNNCKHFGDCLACGRRPGSCVGGKSVRVYRLSVGRSRCHSTIVFHSSSERTTEDDTYWKQNEMSFVITGITFFFPMGFEALGYFENYHPRKQLRWQLGR